MTKPRLTYANVVSTLCLFLVLSTSTAVAARLLTGADIKNGSLTGADVKAGSLTSAHLKSRSVLEADLSAGVVTKLNSSARDGAQGAQGNPGTPGAAGQAGRSAWETIPSGTTVRGVFGEHHISSSDTDRFEHDYFTLPALPSEPVEETDISFATNQAAFTANSSENAACNGTPEAPTAPAGMICLYLSNDAPPGGATDFARWVVLPGEGQLGLFRISYMATANDGANVAYQGTWAYTAP